MGRDAKITSSVLPQCAEEYIELVVKKMGYRRKVQAEVREELAGHFEDALHGVTDEQKRVEAAMELIKGFGEAKVLATLIRRGKKRCRPIWLKAIIRSSQGAGIAILAITLYVGWMFTGRPYISVDYVAELNKMARPVTDENQNGEPYYDKAMSVLTSEPNDYLPKPWQGDMTPERIAWGRQWVLANAEAIRQTHIGNEKLYVWRTYTSRHGAMMEVRLPELHGFKVLATLLGWQAWVDVQNGEFDRALSEARQCHLLGQHVQRSDILVEELIGFALESYATDLARWIVTQPGVAAVSLTRFQADYEVLLARTDFRISYAGESMAVKDAVQRTFTKSGCVVPPVMGSLLHELRGIYGTGSEEESIGEMISVLTHPGRARTLEQAKGFYDKAEELASVTPYKARTLQPTLSEYSSRIAGVNPLLCAMLPAVSRVADVSWTSRANCYALVAQIAAERYRRDKGAYPQSMEELQSAGYLKELPMDPWSDKPLVYRRTGEGYTIYSVGTNFVDDGGNGHDQKGKLISSPSVSAMDLVFWPVASAK
jgi:hypothetical protein